MDPLVRTGAAQGICKILKGDVQTVQTKNNFFNALLINSKNEENLHVRDACALAVESVKKFFSARGNFLDPVSPTTLRNIKILRELLFNPEITAIERARTILNLRDLATKEAAAILGSALSKNRQYMTIVLQQLIVTSFRNFETPITINELQKIISNTNHFETIRHEAIRVLHSIDKNSDKFLDAFKSDKSQVVKDSIKIATYFDFQNDVKSEFSLKGLFLF